MGGEILKGKIKRKQIAGMNLIYKWHTFEYFLDAMEELGFESIFCGAALPILTAIICRIQSAAASKKLSGIMALKLQDFW